MFNRTYNHNEYSQDDKNKVRYLTDMSIKTVIFSQVNYFLPEVLANIPYFASIISSYLDEEKEIKNVNSLIEQMIVVRLINLFTDTKKSDMEKIKYITKPYSGSTDLPNGMTLYNAVIPLQTCETYNYLLGALPIEQESRDVRFSLTGKDELWGDLPPYIITCLYNTIATDIFINSKTRAIYNKQKDVGLSCASKKESNDDLVIVCLKETNLRGEECSIWAKKEKSYLDMKIEAGSILVLKRESYYNWKYTFQENKGLIIIK